MESVSPFLFKQVMQFGFKIIIGETGSESEITFYSSSSNEIHGWVTLLTPLLKY